MLSIRQILKQQKQSNRAALKYFSHFESHRNQQTELILKNTIAHDKKPAQRACILGAGNCYDLDLNRLAKHFAEIHLVDIDRDALSNARSRLPTTQAKKIHIHAPLDISGANKKLEAWRNMQVTPDELMEFPDRAVHFIQQKIPGQFDCVISSSLMSQILLNYRLVIGEQHPLFEAGLVTLLVAHFRLLAALTAQHGQALFISDISSDEIAPLTEYNANNNGIDFLNTKIKKNEVFNYLNPRLLASLIQQDPVLGAKLEFSAPLKSWLWQNGPANTFLVYASRLAFKPTRNKP